jgi:ornithine cyclodeaminase
MKYINETDIIKIGYNWEETVDVIEKAVGSISKGDYEQPIKLYLRYQDLNNRIIAMPAFLGNSFNMAGIKWISSFPRNTEKGIPRANSVTILNNHETGEIISIINTPLVSIIRTASVSGFVIKKYLHKYQHKIIKLGIVGWGPIGQAHYNMFTNLFHNRLLKIFIYDLRDISLHGFDNHSEIETVITKNWEEAYIDSDIFITCTTSSKPYINREPKKGSLQLNVSLRDYTTDIFPWVKNSIIVDDWDEVCRENTDIERMSKEKGLIKENTKTICDIFNNCLLEYACDTSIMFNPMGMAAFDIAVGSYYLEKANKMSIGQELK